MENNKYSHLTEGSSAYFPCLLNKDVYYICIFVDGYIARYSRWKMLNPVSKKSITKNSLYFPKKLQV